MGIAAMSDDESVKSELADIKTKVYLPSSYDNVATRYSELLMYDLTKQSSDELREAFFAVLESASKNFENDGQKVKDGFGVMATKKLFVTSYHSKSAFKSGVFDEESIKKIRKWGLDAANLPYPRQGEKKK